MHLQAQQRHTSFAELDHAVRAQRWRTMSVHQKPAYLKLGPWIAGKANHFMLPTRVLRKPRLHVAYPYVAWTWGPVQSPC